MKRIIATAIVLLVSLAAAGTASAQDHQAKANIPFAFYVDNAWMPAGTYTMSTNVGGSGVVTIVSADNSNSAEVLSLPDETRAKRGELVFRKIGDQYFLHEILCTASSMNRELPASRTEKNAVTREASVAPPSNVYLALVNNQGK